MFDPAAQHGDVDAKIVAALDRLGQAFRVLLREEAKAEGLSPIQIQTLVYLRFLGPARASALAERFDLTAATVSEVVRVLVAKGFVAKAPDPTDGRARVLRLTPSGRALADRLSGWADGMRAHLGGHSDAEKVVVMRFLMDLIGHLQRAGVVTVARMCVTCRYFGRDRHPDPEAPHHCNLLDAPLRLHDLRMDCPEHEPAGVS